MARTKQPPQDRPPTLFRLSLHACAESEIVEFEEKVRAHAIKLVDSQRQKRRRIVRKLCNAKLSSDDNDDVDGFDMGEGRHDFPLSDDYDYDVNVEKQFKTLIVDILEREGIHSVQRLVETWICNEYLSREPPRR